MEEGYESLQEVLQRHTKAQNCPLCIGVDPHIALLRELASKVLHLPHNVTDFYLMQWLGENILMACQLLKLSVVKFQMACFEVLGSRGWKVLEELVQLARKNHFFVILDGKRGDVPSSMHAYGVMAYERLDAHALTLSPYMGSDVWRALWPWFQHGKYAWIVWLSSNPSAHELQTAVVQRPSSGIQQPWLESLVEHVFNGDGHDGDHRSLGLVLGCIHIEHISQALQQRLSSIPLLIPGIGTQGGRVDDIPLALTQPWHLYALSRSLVAVPPSKRGIKIQEQLVENMRAYRQKTEAGFHQTAASTPS